MEVVLIWPNGDWAYEQEVFRPDPGFVKHTVPDLWTDDRVNSLVQQLLQNNKLNFPKT